MAPGNIHEGAKQMPALIHNKLTVVMWANAQRRGPFSSRSFRPVTWKDLFPEMLDSEHVVDSRCL